jgi:hypothetical protein
MTYASLCGIMFAPITKRGELPLIVGNILIRIVVDSGALAFGVLIGWVTYRSLRREGNGAALSDIAAVISAVIGTTIKGLFSTEGPGGPPIRQKGLVYI